jgi:subtilase family serine protease
MTWEFGFFVARAQFLHYTPPVSGRKQSRGSHYARTFLCALLLVALPAFAQTQTTGRQELRGHIPEAVKRLDLQPLGRLSSSNRLHLAIGLPLHDPDGARALIQQLYDPSSPRYHQYLTTEQFAEEFGPTADDYQAAINFARAHGFTVTQTYRGRLLLDVDAAVPDVEAAFQVKLFEYQHPTEHRRFYAPDVEPSVPSGMKILDISGLSSYPSPHPNSHIMKPSSQGSSPNPNDGSVLNGQYIGKDFRAAYVPGSPLTGAGQSVALVQFDNYYASDITNYVNLAGLSFVTLTNILLDHYTGTIGSGNGEVSLDIEMVISMAPGVSKIYLYEGNPVSTNFIPNDVLQRIADDNNSKQISCSWGWNSGPTAATDNIFIEMASHGQSFFVASGDSDAYPGSTVDDTCQTCFGTPASSPYVTSVGGTTLSTAGPTNNWTAETVWNWGVEFSPNENGVGSSGGYSTFYSMPSWQQGISPANLGSTSGRNLPDVAMTGDHVYVAYGNGLSNWFGGTSCASPLWAGFTALVNQQAAATNLPPVGFLNPAIYAIGEGPNYNACFHDITTGNNEWSNSPSAYTALTGYDLCTGWGSPTGTNLINALTAITPILSVNSTIVSGGNGNGEIDANECNLLNLLVQNTGHGTATVISATFTTTTPGVTITQPNSAYPNVAPNSLVTNSTPFQVSTAPSFACGTPVSFSLALNYTGGSTTSTFTMATCVCPDVLINGGLTAGSPNQTGRLQRLYTVSTCNAPKTCPGNLTTSGAYHYQAYSFTNTTSNPLCITVTINTPCQGQSTTGLITTAYLGNYIPNNLCLGYLADQGGMLTTSGTYSFNVPANTNFTVVVNDVTVGAICSSFTLDVAGLPCNTDGGGACAVAGPTANFSGSPTSGTAPLSVTFTDTSSGTITNRFWDFGDSSTTNTTTNAVVHTYAAGVYTVQLIISGPGGVSTNTQPNYINVLTPFQAWQIQYFGSTNNPNAAAGVDVDGTGQNNLFKYVTGLDPTNPASIFILQIAAITNQPAQNNLLFNPLASGRTYTPQFNTDLVNGSWMPLIYFSGPVTNGSQATITDTNAIEPNKFYRLDISLP